MIVERKANERGKVAMGWLNSFHSFSFASYFDPKWMGFSKLRVINEDKIDPKQGFGSHPHRDMEIITFMLDGELEHRDNLGGHEIIRAGEIQVMSAGSGIIHSEFNSSCDTTSHLLQIWIEPNQKRVKPGYTQHQINTDPNQLNLIVSEAGGEGIAKIHQDAKVFNAVLNQNLEEKLQGDKKYWLQVYSGEGVVNGFKVTHGDALGLVDENQLRVEPSKNLSFLLFELP